MSKWANTDEVCTNEHARERLWKGCSGGKGQNKWWGIVGYLVWEGRRRRRGNYLSLNSTRKYILQICSERKRCSATQWRLCMANDSWLRHPSCHPCPPLNNSHLLCLTANHLPTNFVSVQVTWHKPWLRSSTHTTNRENSAGDWMILFVQGCLRTVLSLKD